MRLLPGIARMTAVKCTCPIVCFCFIFVSAVIATSDIDKEEAAVKCWNIGRTAFKICNEGYDDVSSRPNPALLLQMQKRHFKNRLPSYRKLKEPTLYNRGFAKYDGVIVPYFMKRRWLPLSDLSYQNTVPFKMSDSSTVIEKRPFDSISYNAGFGDFT